MNYIVIFYCFTLLEFYTPFLILIVCLLNQKFVSIVENKIYILLCTSSMRFKFNQCKRFIILFARFSFNFFQKISRYIKSRLPLVFFKMRMNKFILFLITFWFMKSIHIHLKYLILFTYLTKEAKFLCLKYIGNT